MADPGPGGVGSTVTRLLFLVPWMRLGGADRFNLALVEQLTRRRVSVTLCVTIGGDHPWLPYFRQFTPDVHILPELVPPQDYPRYLAELLSARDIEAVLVSHSMLGYGLLPYLRSVHPRAAYADYNHIVTTAWRSGGYARMAINYRHFLDLSIVSSNQVKAWMVAHGGDAGRIEVCYTNQDVTVWDPGRFDRAAIRAALGIPPECTVLLYPARLEPQKRPRVLAEIVQHLHRRRPHFVCLVAGDGSQAGWLAHDLARHGLQDCVRLLGAVMPERIPELMAASDILLLPSRDEGIALSLFEAMAMGVIPIAADVGGQGELVTPETGILIPKGGGEVAAYVDNLVRLIDQPGLRAEMGRAARNRISSHFAIEQMGDRMMACLARARWLAKAEPREPISEQAGRAAALRVVEDVLMDRLQETLRSAEWPEASDPKSAAVPSWRRITYWLKKKVLRPAYNWAIRHGLDWAEPAANRLYDTFRGLLR